MTDAEAGKDQDKKADLDSQQSKLEELKQKKEEWFKKKEDLKAEINALITQIKGLKSKGDTSGGSISQIKAERDKHNNEVHELISQAKKLNKEKQDKIAKSKIEFDPSMIKSQIHKLETQIETEAPSFEKEKKMMKQINVLRRQYDETKEINVVVEKLNKLSKQIDEAKEKAEGFHNQMRQRINDNKAGYGEFMTLSKKINDLKAVQEQAFANFTTFKKEFSELNRSLKEKFNGIREQRHAQRQAKSKEYEEHNEAKRKSDEKKLKEKAEEVEEKLKTKKVLTTEDLIAFQGANQ